MIRCVSSGILASKIAICAITSLSGIDHFLFGVTSYLLKHPFYDYRCSISLNGLVINQLGEGADKSGRYYSKLLQEYEAVVISSTLLGEKLSGPTSQGPGAGKP